MSDEQETESSMDDALERVLRFSTRGIVYFLVESSRFRRVPEIVRSKSLHGATADLLEMVGLGLNSAHSTCYAFTDEEFARYGQAKIIEEAPEGRNPVFVRQSVNVTRLLVHAQKKGQKEIIVDYKTPQEFTLGNQQISQAERLALISRIATLPYIYILQDQHKSGMTMEVEGQDCAIAFIKKEESGPALEGIRQEDPKASVGKNRPWHFVEAILESDLDGILFNPATSSQTVLSRTELNLLKLACEVAPRPPSKLQKFVKKIIN